MGRLSALALTLALALPGCTGPEAPPARSKSSSVHVLPGWTILPLCPWEDVVVEHPDRLACCGPPRYFPLGKELEPGWWLERYARQQVVTVVGEAPAAWLIELSFRGMRCRRGRCPIPLEESWLGLAVRKADGSVLAAVVGGEGEVAERLQVGAAHYTPFLTTPIESFVRGGDSLYSQSPPAGRRWDPTPSSPRAVCVVRQLVSPDGEGLAHDVVIRDERGPVPGLLLYRRRTDWSLIQDSVFGNFLHWGELERVRLRDPVGVVVEVGGQKLPCYRVEFRHVGFGRSVLITSHPVVAGLSPACVTAPGWGVIWDQAVTMWDDPQLNEVTAFGRDGKRHLIWPAEYAEWITVPLAQPVRRSP